MKKYVFILLLVCLGCASVYIPTYLQDKKPYTERFYVDFDQALSGATQALELLGWKIERTTDPMLYEQTSADVPKGKRALILTGIRQTPLFFGTRYARLNVFVRTQEDVSEIEIRYLTINSFPFKSITSYQNNSAVQRIFERINKLLDGKMVE